MQSTFCYKMVFSACAGVVLLRENFMSVVEGILRVRGGSSPLPLSPVFPLVYSPRARR